MKPGHFAATIVGISMWAGVASASTVLYDNIPGYPASRLLSAYCSSCGGSNFQVYQSFTLGAAATITHTDFAIFAGFGAEQIIDITFWNSALDTMLRSQTVGPADYTRDASNDFTAGYSIIGTDLAPFVLAAGNYFVSYHSETMAIPGWDFGQQTYVQAFTAGGSNPGSDLDPYPVNMHGAFDIMGTVSGAVPEPATWAMMVIGFGGLGASMRRRRAAIAA
jgi:hypothetical protein